MRRREFMTLLGGAAAWPLAARAEQMREIGFLGSGTDLSERHLFSSFQEGLAETGFAVGENVLIEHRAAEGRTIIYREWPPSWLAARWRLLLPAVLRLYLLPRPLH